MNAQVPGLADIIEPPAIGLFPPAWGWWLLAVVLVVGIAAIVWLATRWHQRRQLALKGLTLLDDAMEQYQSSQNAQAYCRDLNQALKRYCFACTGRHSDFAALNGEEWTKRLRDVNPRANLSAQTLSALSDGPYRPNTDFHAQMVDAELRQWLRTANPDKVRRYGGGHL